MAQWAAPIPTPEHASNNPLEQGEILAIKGLGGFHLSCDASNPCAVGLLRERKRRSGKAFAIMTRDLETAERLCVVTPADRDLLCSVRRPIVLLGRREEKRGYRSKRCPTHVTRAWE